jgi:16S rRNA (guanine(966)-N(2))-methyltransferase RsmD
MRIIAGTGKGRRLAPVKGRGIRPTQDRIREAVFNILEPYGPFYRVADLFAGSGALGLEAVSRWGGEAVLVDRSPEAVRGLKENINRLGFGERCRVIRRDLARGLGFLAEQGSSFDLIFLDPPYGRGWCEKIVPPLLTLPLLSWEGVLVLEHDLEEPVPEQVGEWSVADRRRYGRTRVSFYHFRKGS